MILKINFQAKETKKRQVNKTKKSRTQENLGLNHVGKRKLKLTHQNAKGNCPEVQFFKSYSTGKDKKVDKTPCWRTGANLINSQWKLNWQSLRRGQRQHLTKLQTHRDFDLAVLPLAVHSCRCTHTLRITSARAYLLNTVFSIKMVIRVNCSVHIRTMNFQADMKEGGRSSQSESEKLPGYIFSQYELIYYTWQILEYIFKRLKTLWNFHKPFTEREKLLP